MNSCLINRSLDMPLKIFKLRLCSLLICYDLYLQLLYPNRQIQRYFSALTAAARRPFRFNYSKQTKEENFVYFWSQNFWTELECYLVVSPLVFWFLNFWYSKSYTYEVRPSRKHVSNKQLIILLQVGLLGHTASQKTKLKIKIVGKKKLHHNY